MIAVGLNNLWLQPTQPPNHSRPHCCTHESELCDHIALDVTAHGWVPAGDPRYTLALHGWRAVGWLTRRDTSTKCHDSHYGMGSGGQTRRQQLNRTLPLHMKQTVSRVFQVRLPTEPEKGTRHSRSTVKRDDDRRSGLAHRRVDRWDRLVPKGLQSA